ncbi:hypothetical protein HYY75_08625, partial [bacterium]|nr:hypothetical protein [bacterium]
MSLRVNQNVLAVQTHGILSGTQDRLSKAIEKLSSGLRINRAADDAAGLTISEKLRRQIRGLSRAVMNAQDGISMIQTGESALAETHAILQRMRELAVQSSNDTLTSNDRFEIQKEIVQLRDDINRISRNTEFNTKKLLDGSQAAIVSSSSSTGKAIVTGATNLQGDYNIQIKQLDPGVAQEQRTNIFTLKGTSTFADSSTKLEEIGQFYDANGVFVLATSQTLTIQADSTITSIQVSKDLTLRQLAERIQNAVTDNLKINGSLVYINTPSSNVQGSLQLVSGMAGRNGEIAFSADQGLFNALGFTQTTASSDPVSQVTRSNADGTSPITTQINASRASGLIDGIDIQFEAAAQAKATGNVQAAPGVIISAAVSIYLTDFFGTQATVQFTAGGSYSLD